MAFDTEFDGQTDFSDFLERFRMQELPPADPMPRQEKFDGKKQLNAANRQAQYNRSFEKLEEKNTGIGRTLWSVRLSER